MAVAVITTSGAEVEHASAAKWHVDENDHLHIIGNAEAGNVATYARGTWESVCSDGSSR